MWHRVKVRLGLEDEWGDEEYYEDGEYYEDDPAEVEGDWDQPSRRSPHDSPYSSGAGPNAVRRVDRGPDLDRARSMSGGPLRSIPTGPASVAPYSPQVKMHIIEPKSFSEAQSIGDKFKKGTPVILNLTGTKPELAKRFLDFASGLTYGLDGGLQKVSDKVFMLSPHNVEVSDADRRRLRDTGFFGDE
jgi:cell division inhibitor SepF